MSVEAQNFVLLPDAGDYAVTLYSFSSVLQIYSYVTTEPQVYVLVHCAD